MRDLNLSDVFNKQFAKLLYKFLRLQPAQRTCLPGAEAAAADSGVDKSVKVNEASGIALDH